LVKETFHDRQIQSYTKEEESGEEGAALVAFSDLDRGYNHDEISEAGEKNEQEDGNEVPHSPVSQTSKYFFKS
jgi:hypothetical protein